MLPTLAVIVATTFEVTVVVDIVKLAVEEPAATWTVAGTVAFELLEVNVTVKPPDGATPPRVTVPVAEVPPATAVGEMLRPVSDGG